MQKAIAALGRVCQAAALAAVLSLFAQAVHAEGGKYVEAQTADGVVVREECIRPPALAKSAYICGTLAKKTVEIIVSLTRLLGPFPRKMVLLGPFPSLPVLTAPPGTILVNENMLLFAGDELTVFDSLPGLVARQWLVTDDASSRVASDWLNEGLPEYLAWRYLLDARPEAARALVESAMRDSPAGSRAAQDSVTFRPRLAKAEIPSSFYEQRGLLILRTLETVIDRERVDRVLPELVRRFGQRRISLADFEKVCEEIAGRDLGWFFRYFFDGRGVPEIELRSLPSESPGIVAGEILVRGLPPEGSVRVEMSVRTAQGNVEHSVATRGAVTDFTVNVPAPALGITLDPDERILKWTEAARRSKEQSALLAALPSELNAKNLPAAIELYRRALADDPADESRRAQALHERLGEMETASREWDAALADLEAAVNGHSIRPFDTYLFRARAYVYRGYENLRRGRKAEALADARAGLGLPQVVLQQLMPRAVLDSPGDWRIAQKLNALAEAAAQN